MTKRFITSNADNRIPTETQFLMWVLFGSTSVPRDYFNVFELTYRNGLQVIRHFQEEPEWEETAAHHKDTSATEKVYIIQDDDMIFNKKQSTHNESVTGNTPCLIHCYRRIYFENKSTYFGIFLAYFFCSGIV